MKIDEQVVNPFVEFTDERLHCQKARGVIFGEIINDNISGHIRVQVVLEDFSSQILGMSRTLISKGKIFDAETRESHMTEMAKSLCKHIPVNFTGPRVNDAAPTASHTKTSGDISVTVKKCSLRGDKLVVNYRVLSTADGVFDVNSYDKHRMSRIIIAGQEVFAKEATLGGRSGKAPHNMRTSLVEGIAISGTLTFDLKGTNKKTIDLIEIAGYFRVEGSIEGFKLRYKNIKIQ